jgi:cutinase
MPFWKTVKIELRELNRYTGTMGQIVGPALQRALEGKFPGQVTTMGVRYPASIEGAVSGAINPSDAAGSKDMTAKVKQVFANCPNSKIVLSGYSQGAEQVHGTLQRANLGPDGAKIAAVSRLPG